MEPHQRNPISRLSSSLPGCLSSKPLRLLHKHNQKHLSRALTEASGANVKPLRRAALHLHGGCANTQLPARGAGRFRTPKKHTHPPTVPRTDENFLNFSPPQPSRLLRNPVPKEARNRASTSRGTELMLKNQQLFLATSAFRGRRTSQKGSRPEGGQTQTQAPRPHSPWPTSLRTEVCCPGHWCRRSW